jgi:hypothetical protein
MKKIFVFCLAAMIVGSANAQYANTAWEGLYRIPEETEMILRFSNDTLYLQEPLTGDNFEVMHYSIKNDTLTFSKISGNSDCGDEKGIYKLSIKDDKLFMIVINDDCPGRADAIPFEGLKKIQ